MNAQTMFIKGVLLKDLPGRGAITCEKQEKRHGAEFMISYFDEEEREFSESFFLEYHQCQPETIDKKLHEAAARIRAQVGAQNEEKTPEKTA